MALTATRLEFRIKLSNVDRGVDRDESLVVAQHPSETPDHVVLRVLAWCLLAEERLTFGPGLSTRDTPDLWTHDLTGIPTTWIECGAADGASLKKVMQQHAGLAAHALFSSERRRDELVREVSEWKRIPDKATLDVWLLPESFVADLARTVQKRQSWSVTVVGEQFYIQLAENTYEGALEHVSYTTDVLLATR